MNVASGLPFCSGPDQGRERKHIIPITKQIVCGEKTEGATE